uniref:early light-induced protein 2, chloroplastic-like n=1 Tax=Erigeron canadensis TaxID=72917 RepID=UPI001CB9AF76|nr:early light-induced protein 2, chloroplastic-like [Erigeron canadensis]
MAATSVFSATPVTLLTLNNKTINFSSQFCIKKNTIRCMSSPQDGSSTPTTDGSAKPIITSSSSNPTPTPMSSSIPPPPQPAPKVPKVSTKFNDLFAFSGPVPERINGRLAMIGFVSAMAVELSNGQGLFTQISNGGLTVFVGTSVVLTLASLVPLFQGVRAEAKSNGVMTSDAELLNGRVAMLGLIALAFTEFVTGSALV